MSAVKFETLEAKDLVPASENQYSFIEFHDIEKGSQKVIHPEIKSKVAGILREGDIVEVSGLGELKQMTFAQYLRRIGVEYGYYYKLSKTDPTRDRNEILRSLHQEAIDERTRATIRKHQEYTREGATADNLQQETAQDHSRLFVKTINDLGIDGLEAEQAPARVDYLDGVDEIITLDRQALQSGGEKSGERIFIGVQRSFSDKSKEVTSAPIRFIPERPEIGPLFRVFIKEKPGDYIDEEKGDTIWQKLLDMRSTKARQAGLDPKQFAQSQRNEGLPSVDKVLPGGAKEQITRVRKVLQAIKIQMVSYIESASFAQQPLEIKKQLLRQLDDLAIDDFLAAIDDLELVA